jgi:hypothetical protein
MAEYFRLTLHRLLLDRYYLENPGALVPDQQTKDKSLIVKSRASTPDLLESEWKSGIYTLVLDWPPPADDEQTTGEWAERMREPGEQWREIAAEENRPLPRFVQARWRKLIESFSMSLDQLREDPSLAHALFELAAIADEASAGVGLPRSSDSSGKSASFYRRARRQLLPNEKGSSLCIEIDPTRLRILPKMHAPGKGLTIRSLSHHLALCSGDEICPFWETSIAYASQRESLNLLVVPWPERVKPVLRFMSG